MSEDNDENFAVPPAAFNQQRGGGGQSARFADPRRHGREATFNDQELDALVAPLITDPAVLADARRWAARLGVAIDWLLIKDGLLDEAVYLQRLGAAAGVAVITEDEHQAVLPVFHDDAGATLLGPEPRFVVTVDGFALVPHGLGPTAIRVEIDALRAAQGHPGSAQEGPRRVPHIRLVGAAALRRAYAERHRQRLLGHARDHFFKTAPSESARGGLSRLQWLGLLGLAGGLAYGWQAAPAATALSLSSFFALFFFMLISLRLMAAAMHVPLMLGRAFDLRSAGAAGYDADGELPVYTVLVPLFREAHMLGQLTRALNALDYPRAKLDIKLLLEERDADTIAAARAMRLPGCYEILVVPDGKPLTKPKALNYGLQLARGDYVVIFDAEDVPEPDQLRKALAAFAKASPQLATLQARLNLYNPRQNWLTRQFTIEYSALFDRLLPAYFFIGFPIPLGGTSNHFRRDLLEEIGGWDPYNVTEDADLGVRLYRRGYHSAVLASTTYEEACTDFKSWFYQRTRWLKGWAQTYYVHMRHPIKLLRELGLWRFIGFQAVIGGPLFSSLLHPVFLVILGFAIWQMPVEEVRGSAALISLWVLALFNLAAGYFATMWLGVVSLRLRGFSGFLLALVTIPLYWLMISLAAYRAVFQLIYAPFHWEKTRHKGIKD